MINYVEILCLLIVVSAYAALQRAYRIHAILLAMSSSGQMS